MQHMSLEQRDEWQRLILEQYDDDKAVRLTVLPAFHIVLDVGRIITTDALALTGVSAISLSSSYATLLSKNFLISAACCSFFGAGKSR